MLSGAMTITQWSSSRSRSIPTLFPLHPRVPFARQVDPMRIPAFAQGNLLRAGPSLELLLATDRPMHVVVTIRKPDEVVELMLEDALVEIATDTDIQSAGEAAHDVDAVVAAVAG